MKSRVFSRSYGDQEISNEHLKQAASIVDEHWPEFNVYASLKADWHVLLADQEAEELEK